ncbi:MAG: DUF4365 domain-containing protein [Bacteroidales bacterium]|nr:DUF4365 domain-containing protein [Bacteroidales bacterium]
MKIPNQQIIGNQAESFVSFKLSRFCLIRPVASGTDIGIDLYCESIKENKPHIHFWIQVKGSNDGKASYKFSTNHLEYWDTQPVPVFAFLVTNSKLLEPENYNIYVINITEQLISGLDLKGNSKTLHSDICIKNDDELEDFINKTVEITTSRQKLKDGIISPTPSSKNQYVKYIFSQGASRYSDLIYQTIRVNSAFIVEDLVERETGDPQNEQFKKKRKEFTLVLEAFKERKNWEVPYGLGLSYFQDKRNNDALEQFKRSIDIIRSDLKVNQAEFSPKVRDIEQLIERIENNNNT